MRFESAWWDGRGICAGAGYLGLQGALLEFLGLGLSSM